MFLRNKKTLFSNARHGEDPADGQKDLEDQFEILRHAIDRAAERPDSFWEGQHHRIMTGLQEASGPWRRILQVWVPAAAMILVCLFFFGRNSSPPIPDLAGGYDQNLLLEVERALNQDCPDAFVPAVLMMNEIGRAGVKTGRQVNVE